MHDDIYSCLYIFTHITLSDAIITDVGNFMIPRLPVCVVRGTSTDQYLDLVGVCLN